MRSAPARPRYPLSRPCFRLYCGCIRVPVQSNDSLSASPRGDLDFTKQPTPLSRKASRVSTGMTRAKVLRLLGPPTWATLFGDTSDLAPPDPRIALDLYWRNEGCTPIAVDLDRQYRVTGIDEGRLCGTGAPLFEPSRAYSCNRPDRQRHCRP